MTITIPIPDIVVLTLSWTAVVVLFLFLFALKFAILRSIFRAKLGWRYYDMYFTLLKLSVTRDKGRHSAEQVYEAIRDVIRDNPDFKRMFVHLMAGNYIVVTSDTVSDYAKEIETSISALPDDDPTRAALTQTVENMRWVAGIRTGHDKSATEEPT
jgi:hypothetical protein